MANVSSMIATTDTRTTCISLHLLTLTLELLLQVSVASKYSFVLFTAHRGLMDMSFSQLNC